MGKTIHGHKRRGLQSPEYGSYLSVKKRCLYPGNSSYSNYGGRGIVICQKLLDFHGFLEVLQTKPTPKHQIDRIDTFGNYSCGRCPECLDKNWPMNVRWVTPKQNSNNQRTNRKVTYKGETKNLHEWCEFLAIPWSRTFIRLKAGWSVEDAFETPSIKGRPSNDKCHSRNWPESERRRKVS